MIISFIHSLIFGSIDSSSLCSLDFGSALFPLSANKYNSGIDSMEREPSTTQLPWRGISFFQPVNVDQHKDERKLGL